MHQTIAIIVSTVEGAAKYFTTLLHSNWYLTVVLQLVLLNKLLT